MGNDAAQPAQPEAQEPETTETDYSLARLGARLLFNIFCSRPRVIGREHLEDLDPPYIVACNHGSLIDVGLLVGYFPEPVRFMAKAELAEVPWLGFISRRLDTIYLARDGRDVGPLRHALKALRRDKRCLAIFVEGTRTDEDSALAQAKQGTAMLAARSGRPVVPVFLENTSRAAPRGTIIPVYHQVNVRIGPPVDLGLPEGGKPSPEDLEGATERIREAILALRPDESGEAPVEGPPGPPAKD